MIPEKAYIIRISSKISREYADLTASSCRTVGISFEFIEGVEGKSAYSAWSQSGLNIKMVGVYKTDKIDKAACATVSHALLWKKIADQKETAIILEHDSMMLHPVKLEIPDDKIVVLGYKLRDIERYDHLKAGAPKQILNIDAHEGAHAYAITHRTASKMVAELNVIGNSLPVDNTFFLKSRSSKIPLGIANPTSAIGWLRDSTIWNETSEANYPFIDSFKQHLKG